MSNTHNKQIAIMIKGSWTKMKVSNVVKTAVKLAPIVIPIIRKVVEAKKGTTPSSTMTRRK